MATAPDVQVPEEHLVEHMEIHATMLAAAAGAWRLRAREGRLGGHPLSQALKLAEMLESAARGLRPSSLLEAAANAAGEESDDVFRLLVDTVKDYAIFLLDPAGIIVSWNAGAERINGYSAGEIIGKHFSVLYLPEDRDAGRPSREVEIATQTGRYEEEGWRVRKDGTRIWTNVVLTALRARDGHLRGFAKVTRDFTERKRAEDATRREEQRFRMMVEGVKDYAIFVLDPEGRVASWNEGARRAKGYEASEVLGRHFSLFYPPEAIAAGHPDHELTVAKAEGRYEEEGWRVRKDGSRFYASVVLTAIHDAGELIGFTKVTRDLTERLEARESLRRLAADLERRVAERTDELLLVNKELEAFSYTVSHDLRAPLRALDGFSRLLLSSASGKLTPEEQSHLDRIRAAAQRMGHLVDGLLDLSRLTRAPIKRERIDVSELARAVLADLGESDPDRRVDLVVADGLAVDADPRLVRIAMENLLANAWKFTRNGAAARIELGSTTNDGATELFVRDNGTGFEMKYAGKLFTPFQRLHSVKDFEGTGIGLATVHRIIQRHGGTIRPESQLGSGTTFYFTLEGRQ